MTSPRLPRKPEARTEKVEDLVEKVLRGRIRIPWFQRGLKWDAADVQALFDSIYRGYPIGSLLFYKRPAPAERLTRGPLVIDAPEIAEAWWVVDGQQRLTALASCLARPVPLPTAPNSKDPYVLYFDAEKQEFALPQRTRAVPSTWVPLPYLLEASGLSEWVYRWQHQRDERLRQAVFAVGSRVREYPIPLYLIETEDSKVTEEIYYRTNTTGKPLQWKEVHKALFGGEEASPSTLSELAKDLAEVGMGRLDEERLLTCLLAIRGKDPTRTLTEHYRQDPEVLRDAVQEALPILRRVLSFLQQDADIPHLRLLPQSILLDVLARFFACHENPGPRPRTLLARWLWRTILGAGTFDDRTLRRSGIKAVVGGAEESLQRLLQLVRKEAPRPFELPPSFDARAADSRIVLLALSHLQPRELLRGERLDVAGLIEREDRSAFVKILRQSGLDRSRSPANWLILGKGQPVQRLLRKRIEDHGVDDPVLASHAIDPPAAERLVSGDLEGFLARRSETLTTEVRRFGARLAAWEHNDRPSVDYLLEQAGVEV